MRQKLPLVLVLFFTPALATAQRNAAPAMPTMAAHPVSSFAAPAPHLASAGSVAAVHASSHPVTGVHSQPRPVPRGTVRPATSPKQTVRPQPVVSSPTFAGTSFGEESFGTPGLGFDYAHFAAVHPSAGRRHFTGGVVPFVGGGIYIPYPMYMDNEAAAEPDEESAQSEDTPPETEQPGEEAVMPSDPGTVRSRAHSSTASQPDSEYVFVRRDGTVFFAVAFTFDSSDLHYITQEGFRKTVPLASLDLTATQQFNEQRGLSPRLPS